MPLLAVGLAGSRRRWTPRPTLGYHLSLVIPALAGSGLFSLALWRVADALGAPWPIPIDGLLMTCAVAPLTVTLGRMGGQGPSGWPDPRPAE